MITKIKKRSEFLKIQKSGFKAVTSGLILQSAKNSQEKYLTRYGFTASRRVGGAVLRNKAKRRMRFLVDLIMLKLGKPGWDYVLIARYKTPNRKFEKLKSDLYWAIKNVNTQTQNL
jgi:ribonuclease P protein component